MVAETQARMHRVGGSVFRGTLTIREEGEEELRSSLRVPNRCALFTSSRASQSVWVGGN